MDAECREINSMTTKKERIVLYPSPGMGHLVPMVELGKRILLHHTFSITILITSNPPWVTGDTESYIQSVAKSHPSITFYRLPSVSLSLHNESPPSMMTLIFHFLLQNNPLVLDCLQTISLTNSIHGVILDFFCATTRDVVTQLKIPCYFFFPNNLSSLLVIINFPTLHNQTTTSIKDLTHPLNFPGVPSIHPSDMPRTLSVRHAEGYDEFLCIATSLLKANGVLVNTFASLEPRALRAIQEGACAIDEAMPPIYTIGPLTTSKDSSNSNNVDCLLWLDSQPSKSVVFLCFGSMGLFSVEQLKAIAVGLEKSMQRFLWVVRDPRPAKDSLTSSDFDLDKLLPEGFLDRTRDRGLVLKSWAPQVAVLSRESVGGFVSHCGWNSILEAVCAGVPMLAWPLYAEQRMNKVFLVEEWKLAMAVAEEKDGFVSTVEIERSVRGLMVSDEGKRLRKQTVAVRERALGSLKEGGSSHAMLAELAQLLKEPRSSSK